VCDLDVDCRRHEKKERKIEENTDMRLRVGGCSLLGPTLLDLQHRTGSTTSQISWLFTGRSFGYLGGSIAGGFIFDRLNTMLIFRFVCILVCGV